MADAMHYCYLDSPVGELLLAGDASSLRVIGFPDGSRRRRHEEGWVESAEPFQEVRRQLDEYFSGSRQDFDLPLAPAGTEFQRCVYDELQRIPYGSTISYAELAERIERPKAVRAVGAANGQNPIPIVIPCHRVIGSDGSLTGFGGGLPIKRALLALEFENREFTLS